MKQAKKTNIIQQPNIEKISHNLEHIMLLRYKIFSPTLLEVQVG